MNPDLLVIELSRRNPYPRLIEMEELKNRKKNLRAANRGYEKALEMLSEMVEHKEVKNIEEDKHFLTSAYGLKCRDINGYHVRIEHEEYDGMFDWYHTSGTLLACRNGASTNLGKIKDAEQVGERIKKHVYHGIMN